MTRPFLAGQVRFLQVGGYSSYDNRLHPSLASGDTPLISLRPRGIGSLRIGNAVVKVGDSAAGAPLTEQLKVEARVPRESVFAAS